MDLHDEYSLIHIDAAELLMGSSEREIEACVAEWRDRLVDPAYAPHFRSWIRKEAPAHAVHVSACWLARYPVTNRQYRAYLAARCSEATESIVRDEPPDHPVWGLTLPAIEGFLVWLRQRTGLPVRLPTEAEWEHAARGPEHWEYPFGARFDPRCCNTREAEIGATTPVSRYASAPSAFGLHDLAGNVEEFTGSEYRAYPGGVAIADDLTQTLGQRYPVLRGGSFQLGGDLARSARRHGRHPGPQFRFAGFRIALDARGECKRGASQESYRPVSATEEETP